MQLTETLKVSNLFELTLEPLIEKYGPRFVLKLAKSVMVFEKEPSAPKSVPFLEPHKVRKLRYELSRARSHVERNAKLEKTLEERSEALLDEYIELVTQAGFKIKTWDEDYVDEDTGEIITIERKEFYCLYLKQKPA